MLRLKTKKIFFYLGVLFVAVLLIVGLTHILKLLPNSTEKIIELKKNEIKSEGNGSRVYKVSDESGNTFLLSSDQKLNPSKGYFLQELHVNSFWNPITCSKVPFVRRGQSIYFLEIKKMLEGDLYINKTYIYVLNTATKQFTSYEVSNNLTTTGYIYKDQEVIYVASPNFKNNLLADVVIYTFDEQKNSLVRNSIMDMDYFNIKIPTFKRYKSQIALSYFDEFLTKKNLVYDGSFFNSEEIFPEEIATYEGDDYKVFNFLSSKFLRKINIKKYDDIKILDKQTNKILIEIKDDSINKYIITEL